MRFEQLLAVADELRYRCVELIPVLHVPRNSHFTPNFGRILRPRRSYEQEENDSELKQDCTWFRHRALLATLPPAGKRPSTRLAS